MRPKVSTNNPALDCGMSRHDGVIVALIPPIDAPDEYVTSFGTLFVVDGMAVDLLPSDRAWWKVKEAAREVGVRFPEPLWHGCAEEFPFNTEQVQVKALEYPADKRLCMRNYRNGPWIDLTPEQQKKESGDEAGA